MKYAPVLVHRLCGGPVWVSLEKQDPILLIYQMSQRDCRNAEMYPTEGEAVVTIENKHSCKQSCGQHRPIFSNVIPLQNDGITCV